MIDYRSCADKELLCHFVVSGQPATKKNSSRIIWVKKFPRVIPSKQFVAYEKQCQPYCEDACNKLHNQIINFGVAIRIKVWIKKWQLPDHVGILQSIGDIFQKYGVVADDKYIHWTDCDFLTGQHEHWFMGVDKENPRIEVWMYRFKHPIEDYEASKKPVKPRTTVKKTVTPKRTVKKRTVQKRSTT